jgi:hypothetical protein
MGRSASGRRSSRNRDRADVDWESRIRAVGDRSWHDLGGYRVTEEVTTQDWITARFRSLPRELEASSIGWTS